MRRTSILMLILVFLISAFSLTAISSVELINEKVIESQEVVFDSIIEPVSIKPTVNMELLNGVPPAKGILGYGLYDIIAFILSIVALIGGGIYWNKGKKIISQLATIMKAVDDALEDNQRTKNELMKIVKMVKELFTNKR